MYKTTRPLKKTFKNNKAYEGETIEMKIRRIMNNKEPISDGAPLIYTERKKGVLPEHDIRTDRFEIALDAMTTVAKAQVAQRENKPTIGEQAKAGMDAEKKTEGQPLQGTDNK